jgi:hypothetical protein
MVAVPLTPTGASTDALSVDITAHVVAGRLHWDIPPGHWRLVMIVQTPLGGGDPNYVNPIDRASARVLIDPFLKPNNPLAVATAGSGTTSGCTAARRLRRAPRPREQRQRSRGVVSCANHTARFDLR